MKQRKIIVIEDDEADVLFYRRSLAQLQIANPIQFFSSATAAADVLAKNPTQDLPAAILMDTNTPGMTGADFLRWIKSQAPLAGIPVVAISSAKSPTEVDELKKLGAAAFFQKPGASNWRDMLLQIFKTLHIG